MLYEVSMLPESQFYYRKQTTKLNFLCDLSG